MLSFHIERTDMTEFDESDKVRVKHNHIPVTFFQSQYSQNSKALLELIFHDMLFIF